MHPWKIRGSGVATVGRNLVFIAPCDHLDVSMDLPATELVNLAAVEAAQTLLAGVIRTTPLEPSRPLTASWPARCG